MQACIFGLADEQRIFTRRQRGRAGIPLPVIADREQAPSGGVLAVDAPRGFEGLDGYAKGVFYSAFELCLGQTSQQQGILRPQGHGCGIGRHGVCRMPVLKKHLPLELVKIGVPGQLGDQRIDLA